MPTETDDGELNKLLTELGKEPEESIVSKNKSKKEYKNDDNNEYEVNDSLDDDDREW